MATRDWKESARQALHGLKAVPEAWGWGYQKGSLPCVEPTSLAVLGLLASRDRSAPDVDTTPVARGAADWLCTVQQPNGSIGVSQNLPEPGWGSPYALLAWGALDGYSDQRKRAVKWLLGQSGETFPKEDGPAPVLGHDPSLVGWPWVNGTHSWVEPTSLAVLALRREGYGKHPRVEEGLRVIRDRAIESGGWNCGNKATYGRVLRPQPAPSGLALLALAGSGPCADIVEKAIEYLHATLPGVRAAESLAWGVLGLRAWGHRVVEADRWLAESYERVSARADAAPRLALLLLASGDHAMEFFDAK